MSPPYIVPLEGGWHQYNVGGHKDAPLDVDKLEANAIYIERKYSRNRPTKQQVPSKALKSVAVPDETQIVEETEASAEKVKQNK